MAFGISKPRLSPIAVDFGADALKVLQIETGGEGAMSLVAAASVPLPDAARQESATRSSFLAETLKTVLRQRPFRGKRAMIAIPAFQTLAHNYEIPACNDQDLASQADLYLQTRLGLDPRRVVARHQSAGNVARDGRNMTRVLTTAAPRETVMHYVELAQGAKLEVEGVHSEAACVVGGFSRVFNRRAGDEDRPVLYIDLGAVSTKIALAQGPKLVLARVAAVGGDAWTRSLSRREKLTFAEARLARIAEASGARVECPAGPNGSLDLPEEPWAETSTETTAWDGGTERRGAHFRNAELAPPDGKNDPAFKCLVDELQMSLRYYEGVCPERPVEQAIFCGGEANRLATCRALARAVGLPGRIGEPFARVQRDASSRHSWFDPDTPSPGLAVALGLCL
ncbi:MAG: pilus assembly protein PilM, partial [Planctomycetota bacterium]